MKPLPLAALPVALLLAACGNYSNEDLIFYNALPDRAQLTSHAPDSGTGAGGSSLLGRGSGTESAGVGEHSTVYDDVGIWVLTANGIVYSVLDLVEAVTRLPPTTRLAHERIWGPAPAKNQPGFLVELVMERREDHFDYRLEFRLQAQRNAPWIPVLVGDFVASEGVRKGVGSFILDSAIARDNGIPLENMNTLTRLSAGYDTRTSEPLTVSLTAVYLPSLHYPDFHYSDTEAANAPTVMTVDGPLADKGGLPFSILGMWVGSGAGRATLKTLSPDGTTRAEVTECWDVKALILYQALAGAGEAGTRSACEPPLP